MGFNPRDVVSCLQEDLSEFTGDYSPFDSVKVAAGSRMKSMCTKKFVYALNSDASDVALMKFVEANEACKQYKFISESSWDDELIGNVKNEIYHFWNRSGDSPLIGSFCDIFDKCSLGPGSNILANGTDFYTKLFDSKLSTTSELLYRAYRATTLSKPVWLNAELHRSAIHGPPRVVEGNRLTFVRKSNETDRTICTEPTLNMLYQLGIGGHIDQRLREVYNIDLASQQSMNRAMALRGSKDGSFCTIDLKSASDTISLSLLREILPRDFLSWLTSVRSRTCKLPSGEFIDLHMISSMGNGFTFSLQTLIFSACVAAVYRQLSIPLDNGRKRDSFGNYRLRNWSVFGDDIIVVGRAYDRICHLLKRFGFVVNAAKSFSEGPFRESCGLDAFKGVDIRPVFCQVLDLSQNRYAYINALLRWSSRHGIQLTNTLRYLIRSVPFITTPPWENDDAGIHVPNHRSPKSRNRNGSVVYRRWVVKPSTISVYDDRICVPRGMKRRTVNVDGLYISFLRGDLRNMAINVRHDVNRYMLKKSVAPGWELPDGDPRYVGLDGRAWSRHVDAILTT